MLRAFSLAILMIFAVPPAFAAPPAEDTTIAQQQSPRQAPKRDCEKTQDEGVS